MASRRNKPSKAPKEDLPHVQVAAFFENVLEEKDNVVSLIRMVDTFFMPPPPEAEGETPVLPLKGLLAFKAGRVTGERVIKVFWTDPSGKKGPAREIRAVFNGDVQGVIVGLNITLVLKGEGVYWCDVLVGDTTLTRMPVRIVYREPDPEQPAPGPAGDPESTKKK